MTKIFLSYRRDDSIDITERIHEQLEQHFGSDSVFIDMDTIPAGADFREVLTQAVEQCDVLLAIVGNRWLNACYLDGPHKDERRLDDPDDFVRIEIESALQQNKPVIPVLVGNATMPSDQDLPPSLQPLAFRQATEVRRGRDFHVDIARFVRQLKKIVQSTSSGVSGVPTKLTGPNASRLVKLNAELKELRKSYLQISARKQERQFPS